MPLRFCDEIVQILEIVMVMREKHPVLPDGVGKVDGIIGGYQPWADIYYGLGYGGFAVEDNIGGDIPGIFHTLRRLAVKFSGSQAPKRSRKASGSG